MFSLQEKFPDRHNFYSSSRETLLVRSAAEIFVSKSFQVAWVYTKVVTTYGQFTCSDWIAKYMSTKTTREEKHEKGGKIWKFNRAWKDLFFAYIKET